MVLNTKPKHGSQASKSPIASASQRWVALFALTAGLPAAVAFKSWAYVGDANDLSTELQRATPATNSYGWNITDPFSAGMTEVGNFDSEWCYDLTDKHGIQNAECGNYYIEQTGLDAAQHVRRGPAGARSPCIMDDGKGTCQMTGVIFCVPCTAVQYQTQECSGTTSLGCTAVTVCTAQEFETSAATSNSDRACQALTVCGTDQYQTQAATATTDRQCSPLTICTTEEHEVMAGQLLLYPREGGGYLGTIRALEAL